MLCGTYIDQISVIKVVHILAVEAVQVRGPGLALRIQIKVQPCIMVEHSTELFAGSILWLGSILVFRVQVDLGGLRGRDTLSMPLCCFFGLICGRLFSRQDLL